MLFTFTMFTLMVDAAPLVAAAAYSAWPSDGKLALMRPLSLAALCSIGAGTLIGLVSALQRLAASPNPTASWRPVYGTMSEALGSAILGLACLTASWLLVAVGLRRGSCDGTW